MILVAGLSRAGKSTLADQLATYHDVSHLPLDRYFLPTPDGVRFLDFVQSPDAIDWSLLQEHLAILCDGKPCYSPVIDPWVTGLRLSAGGTEAHPKAMLMQPASTIVLPGCLAFHFAAPGALRVFVDTPLAVIAARLEGRPVAAGDVEATLIAHLTDNYHAILAEKRKADVVADGERTASARKAEIRTLLDMAAK